MQLSENTTGVLLLEGQEKYGRFWLSEVPSVTTKSENTLGFQVCISKSSKAMLKRTWGTGKIVKINSSSAHKLGVRFYRGVMNAPPSLVF